MLSYIPPNSYFLLLGQNLVDQQHYQGGSVRTKETESIRHEQPALSDDLESRFGNSSDSAEVPDSTSHVSKTEQSYDGSYDDKTVDLNSPVTLFK
jgi:hypothetical protein